MSTAGLVTTTLQWPEPQATPRLSPDDAAVVEALPNAKLHRQVCHRPAGVASDQVRQVLQHLHMQDLHRALVEGWQLGGELLEVHQGICL